ncbi:ATP-binding protein [Sphingomonas sp. PP-CE-1G-424]|uniref:ATP-binding protein n=1 Tax=Sphingomonas sp. PP-CE-1G-424 TaxID=2135658 RepID=UPI001056CD97|nr:ATP-binding protein [Sphingomonas sp. PP-CE-1G-424]TCP72974.1 molecular chaperone HtpG [Sphingomonas sp. PP-CE-1G-424]
MSAPIRLAKASEVVEGGPAVVGKDVLELLSTAMYVEPLTIYREYVQNAADAIDQARAGGKDAGRIEIVLDAAARTVSIRDDGAGIPASHFRRVLTSVGASAKRGTEARGFRGVGRLSGLAYARSLTFQSRAAGEARVSTMTWNCQALRSALRDPADTRDLTAIIDAITTTTVTDEAGDPYFEVRLDGVARQGDDRVVSQGAVADYLSEIAPVPLDTSFSHSTAIAERLIGTVALGDLTITINGREPLTRPFRDELPIDGGRPLRLREVAFVEVPSIDGGIAAVGWIAHHDYEGAIHASTHVRGLRVRAGDVQVGEAGVLADVFPESRFDAWTVGEIHVLDPRIIPNGRRDDFERNVHLANLKNHLAPLGRDVANRCRTSSRDRKRLRDLVLEQAAAREGLAVLAQGGLNAAGRDRMALGVELSLMRAEKLLGEPDLVDDANGVVRGEVTRLRTELEQLAGSNASAGSPLDRLSPDRRGFYEEMFSLIYECSANRSAAKSLVDRIMSKVA